jgi:hypothetical protein
MRDRILDRLDRVDAEWLADVHSPLLSVTSDGSSDTPAPP